MNHSKTYTEFYWSDFSDRPECHRTDGFNHAIVMVDMSMPPIAVELYLADAEWALNRQIARYRSSLQPMIRSEDI